MSERFLSVDEVVENAMLSIDDVDSRDRVVFRQWAYIALRQIGFSQLDIQEACVDVCNLSFRKPDNLASTIDVSIMDTNGFSCNYHYVANKGLLPIDEANLLKLGYGVYRIILSEDNDYYHLSSNATNIIQANIKYYGFPIDENGNPKIPERNLLAIMSFIEFMYVKRKQLSDKKVSNSSFSEYRDIWQREMMKAKAKNKMPNMHQGAQIAKKWMSMINRCSFKN